MPEIEALEDTVRAWTFFDPAHALHQAHEADRLHRANAPLGPLHGVPVGIKDIFDTSDMPTENGTVLHAGRTPVEDAAAVALLRAAGAVIMGKTVTTELAVYSPGKTRNPHDPSHTPGGSSSGSAAAVAAEMVPLAIGSQTNGSVIRPAAYCGVYGYKPTHGLVSLYGALAQSVPLDTIGVFARNIEDLALITEQLMVYDGRDPNQRPRARAALVDTAAQQPPVPPRIAFVKTPIWPKADAEKSSGSKRVLWCVAFYRRCHSRPLTRGGESRGVRCGPRADARPHLINASEAEPARLPRGAERGLSGRKGGAGVDAAFDAIGGAHFSRSFASLAKGGLLIGYGRKPWRSGVKA